MEVRIEASTETTKHAIYCTSDMNLKCLLGFHGVESASSTGPDSFEVAFGSDLISVGPIPLVCFLSGKLIESSFSQIIAGKVGDMERQQGWR